MWYPLEMLVPAPSVSSRAPSSGSELADNLTEKHWEAGEQERLFALGEMASGIAHDFNNALAQILGFSELLLRGNGMSDQEQVRDYVQRMHTAAENAANVVRRLREFYRQRDPEEVFHPLDLNDIVQQTIALTQPKWKDQAQASNGTIRIKTDLNKIPLVCGIEADLRDALTNLIFNSVDAMPVGGTLFIRTNSSGRQVVLEVSDTGIGMSDAVREQCLRPFFTTKGEHGTGLGLGIVYGTVQRHEGTFELQSARGEGTTAVMRFPAMPQSAHPETAPSLDDTPSPPLRMLVVEDEPSILGIVAEYLTSDGHTVVTAADGKAALDLFRSGRFDMVLTDRAMPDMSGDELAATIRQLAVNKPIIMFTGFGDLMSANGERPLGVDLVLSKPMTPDSLRRAVAEVFPYPEVPLKLGDDSSGGGAKAASSKTVLVVDDDQRIRDILEAVLKDEGYEVQLARDGFEAMERIEEKLPAAVVLDMMMPRMDGGTFAEELERRGVRQAVPLLVVTADPLLQRQASQFGAEGFLTKPFDVPVLLDEVARVVAVA